MKFSVKQGSALLSLAILIFGYIFVIQAGERRVDAVASVTQVCAKARDDDSEAIGHKAEIQATRLRYVHDIEGVSPQVNDETLVATATEDVQTIAQRRDLFLRSLVDPRTQTPPPQAAGAAPTPDPHTSHTPVPVPTAPSDAATPSPLVRDCLPGGDTDAGASLVAQTVAQTAALNKPRPTPGASASPSAFRPIPATSVLEGDPDAVLYAIADLSRMRVLTQVRSVTLETFTIDDLTRKALHIAADSPGHDRATLRATIRSDYFAPLHVTADDTVESRFGGDVVATAADSAAGPASR